MRILTTHVRGNMEVTAIKTVKINEADLVKYSTVIEMNAEIQNRLRKGGIDPKKPYDFERFPATGELVYTQAKIKNG